MHAALCISGRVDAQTAGTSRRISLSTAVACEVSLGEYLDKSVFAMALDRASIADSCTVIRVLRFGGGRIAGQAGEDTLAKGSENIGAAFDALWKVRIADSVDRREMREDEHREEPRARRLPIASGPL